MFQRSRTGGKTLYHKTNSTASIKAKKLHTTLFSIIAIGVVRADSILLSLEAAPGQGLGASSRLRATSLTYVPSLGSSVTTIFSYSAPGEPSLGTEHAPGGYEFLMTVHFGSFSSGATNVWTGSTLQSSISVNGDFMAAGINTFSPSFQGALGGILTLVQPGGGSNAIMSSPVALSLSSSSAGSQLLNYFAPGATLTSASLNSLSFLPDAPVGANGIFTSTGKNFLSGVIELDFNGVAQASVPEPATFGIGIIGLVLAWRAPKAVRRRVVLPDSGTASSQSLIT